MHIICGGLQARIHGGMPITGQHVAGEVTCIGFHGNSTMLLFPSPKFLTPPWAT